MVYLKGAKNADGTAYTPTNPAAEHMTYENHQWVLTIEAVLNLLRNDLLSKMKEEDANQFLQEISDEIYTAGMLNPYNDSFDIFEFKAARTPGGRDAIQRAMLAQVKYAIRTGNDMKEWSGKEISEYALRELRKGNSYLVSKMQPKFSILRNPDPTRREFPYTEDPDGWRNGY